MLQDHINPMQSLWSMLSVRRTSIEMVFKHTSAVFSATCYLHCYNCYMLLQCVCAFARDTTDILDNCVLKNTITWSHHHNSNDPNWKWPRHKSWGARGVLSLCFPVPGSIVHFALGSYYHVQWECSLEPRPGWLSCWVSTWPASDFRLPSRSFSLTRFFSFR